MSRYCICVVMGLPGSGKTTTCKFFIDTSHTDLAEKDTEIVYFCFDELAKQFQAKKSTYKEFRNQVYEYIEDNLNKLLPITDRRFVLLLDDIMYYRSMRRVYYNLCKKYKISYCQVYMKCDYHMAITRNTFRKGDDRFDRVLPESIFHMGMNLEVPSTEPWERFTCELSSATPTNPYFAEVMWNTIKSSMLCPVETVGITSYKVEDEIDTTSSPVHQVDLILRKYISEKIVQLKRKTPDANISKFGRDLSVRKKEFMEKLKFSDLDLSQPNSFYSVLDSFREFCSDLESSEMLPK